MNKTNSESSATAKLLAIVTVLKTGKKVTTRIFDDASLMASWVVEKQFTGCSISISPIPAS